MPYSPTADGIAMANKIAANLAAAGLTAMQDSIAAGNLAPAAMADALLASMGFQAQSSSMALGTASTTSSSFADVGNGTSTGFAPYVFAAPIAKTYLVHVDLACYVTTSVRCLLNFRLDVNGTTYEPAATALADMNDSALFYPAHFRLAVPMVVGNNTIRIQWRRAAGASATGEVNVFTGRTITVTG